MPPERVAILVTHLLGSGHLVRAAALGRALAGEGHEVLLLSGGMPAPLVAAHGLRFHQLPPVRVEGTAFSRLLRTNGSPVDEPWLAARSNELVGALAAFRPTALIVELFPFGRRALRREFVAALEAAAAMRPRPAIVCSLRDVLAPPSSPERAAFAEETLGRFFEYVLVHGDPEAIPLERSWPVTAALARHLAYTGYVDAAAAADIPIHVPRSDELVVVSGGASGAGMALFEAALGAASRLSVSHRFHILVGHGVDDAAFLALRGKSRELPVVVERARQDFRALLRRAGVSVSRAGYNTVLDLAASGVAAVLVPFEEGGEVEQRIRADALGTAGLAQVVPEVELSGARLAQAIRAARAARSPKAFAARRDGAAQTAAAVARFARAAREREVAVRELEAALDEAQAAKRPVRFWWRDDDAVAATPALERLLALRQRFGLPLALAVIPAKVQGSLADSLSGVESLDLLVHGFSHDNHAASDQKKQELVASRGVEAARSDLAEGLARLRVLFGNAALPVLVPPWNRIDTPLLDLLPGVGYRALSAFQGRYNCKGPPGLIRIDTHIDPIDWRRGGRLPPAKVFAEAAAWVRRAATAPTPFPVGILSHHLQHDAWSWGSLEEFLAFLSARPDAAFVSVRDVLDGIDSAFARARRVAKLGPFA